VAFTNCTYAPYDLNHPMTALNRRGGPSDFDDDSSITGVLHVRAAVACVTEIGRMHAKLVGRGLRVGKASPDVVYASPALRCVQTAAAVLNGADCIDLRIRVEPALIEWKGYYEHAPCFLTVLACSRVRT
jgi:ubiquitin-associated SH3 domain-containing protein